MIPAKAMMVAAADLNARFRYKPDPKFNDRWTILRNDPAEGDCDDYATTVAWLLSGQSVWTLLRNVARRRAQFWYCETASGESHLVLCWDGWWIDNIHRRWLTDRPHFEHRRARLPVVILKMLGTLWALAGAAAQTGVALLFG